MDPEPAPEDDLPPRPVPPRDEDCCRSDCPNCVFNLYDRQLADWEECVEKILAKRRERGASPGTD